MAGWRLPFEYINFIWRKFMRKNLVKSLVVLGVLLAAAALFLPLTGCSSDSKDTPPKTYTVTFEGNGNTGGAPPADITKVKSGASITLPGNDGSMVKPDNTFGGWNTKADGTGTSYAVGASYKVTGNVILFANWVDSNTEFTVSFHGNANSGGSAPTEMKGKVGSSITLPGAATLVKTGYTFGGWNTLADGTGTGYAVGASYTISGDITLFADWVDSNTEFTVMFNGNANSGGSAPTEIKAKINDNITLPGAGDLAKTGFIFSGWNTLADGSGTNYNAGASYKVTASATLFAKWAGPVAQTNANIRAPSVSATNTSAPTTTYGLYIGGNPAVSNGTPAAEWNGSGIASGIIAGNYYVAYALGSPVVVITEEDTVSKVEFGQIFSSSTATEPATWQNLTKNDEDGSAAVAGKRWVGKLDETTQWTTAGANTYVCYVRITAGNGTTRQVYRYGVTIGNWAAGNNGYCTLATLTIGGVNVVTASADVAPNSAGTPGGWWNVTASPNLTAGEVTITSGTNVAVAATWTMGGQTKTYSYAILPASTPVPLKEGDTVTFTSGELTSIPSIENGGYIVLRAHYVSNNYPVLGHYLIKVNVAP
jgi:hypothetical protein